MRIKIILILAGLILVMNLYAQDPQSNATPAPATAVVDENTNKVEPVPATDQENESSTIAKSYNMPEIFKKTTTKIKDPMALRDPFRMNVEKLMPPRGEFKMNKDGVYSNITPMGEIQVMDIKVVGILLGPERRAMVRIGAGTDTYVLKEGMKLGPEKAEIKAILPGGMVLVEKIKNIYNQDEYLETIIPLSRD
jgi:hypothetical protein